MEEAQDPEKAFESGRWMRRLFFVVLVAGVSYWFFDLVQPFLMTVFWAVVLAIVFAPIAHRISNRFPNRPSLVASLTTVFITLVVLLPIAGVSIAVVDQVRKLIMMLNSGELDPGIAIDFAEERLPIVREFLGGYGIEINTMRDDLNTAIANAGQWLLNSSLRFGQNFLATAVEFFLMLYFLWFFLRDGKQILQVIIEAMPLDDRDEMALLQRFATVSRATLKGTLIVAVIQGSLGGLMFWVLGIPGALFWGVIMTLLSLLPVGGSALVWVPAAVILAIQGAWIKAIIIVAFGGLAIGLVDNLLRPQLVGRDTKMPDYLVLIATLGGISSFGLAGFVLGPVVAALFLSVWEMMRREFAYPNPSSSDTDHGLNEVVEDPH